MTNQEIDILIAQIRLGEEVVQSPMAAGSCEGDVTVNGVLILKYGQFDPGDRTVQCLWLDGAITLRLGAYYSEDYNNFPKVAKRLLMSLDSRKVYNNDQQRIRHSAV